MIIYIYYLIYIYYIFIYIYIWNIYMKYIHMHTFTYEIYVYKLEGKILARWFTNILFWQLIIRIINIILVFKLTKPLCSFIHLFDCLFISLFTIWIKFHVFIRFQANSLVFHDPLFCEFSTAKSTPLQFNFHALLLFKLIYIYDHILT